MRWERCLDGLIPGLSHPADQIPALHLRQSLLCVEIRRDPRNFLFRFGCFFELGFAVRSELPAFGLMAPGSPG